MFFSISWQYTFNNATVNVVCTAEKCYDLYIHSLVKKHRILQG